MTVKISSGVADSGTRWVQFWDDGLLAYMTSQNVGGPVFAVEDRCPDAVIPAVLDAWARFRAGENVEATHEMGWVFGKPVFTEIDSQNVLTNV